MKKNLIYNILFQLVKIAIPLILAPYTSRVLGAEGIGIYSYYYSIASYFLMFAMLGLANYGCREIALCKNDNLQEKKFKHIYIIQVATSILSIALYGIFCAISQNQISIIFILYLASSLFDISWYYFGKENFSSVVATNCFSRVLITAIIFLTVKTKDDVWLYCALMSASFIIPNAIIWLRKIKLIFKHEIISLKELKEHFLGNLLLFIPIIAISIYKTMDKIMLGAMTNYENVGLYENAEKIISVPMGFITALGFVMIPKISSNIANNIKNKKYIDMSMKYVAIIIMPIIFGTFAISKYFVPIFYGDDFMKTADILNILMISTVFLGWANIIRTQILIPYKMDSVYIKSVFIGAAINLILNLILINTSGAIGVSIATVAAEMSVCVYQTLKVRKMKQFNTLKELLPFIKYLIISLVMFASSLIINLNSNMYNLIGKILISVITYTAIVVIIDRKELLQLYKDFKATIIKKEKTT